MIEMREHGTYRELWIDEIHVDSDKSGAHGSKERFHFHVSDPTVFTRLEEYSLAELPRNVSLELWGVRDFLGSKLANNINKFYGIGEWGGTNRIWAHVTIDPTHWKELWSPTEYVTCFINHVQRLDSAGLEAVVLPPGQIGVLLSFEPDTRIPLRQAFEQFNVLLVQLQDAVRDTLLSDPERRRLVFLFDFPEDVRVSCVQYLLYFVQFLTDVGVDAEAEITNEAGHVVFSVTPTTGSQTVDNIRSALDTYLQLASASKIGNSLAGFSDYRVQRLAANIQHLQGQLMLANSVLQFKESTIQQQEITIRTQAALLDGSILQRGRLPTRLESDKESILGGTVSITKFEAKGFEVNLPEIFRRIRKMLGTPEEK